MDQCAACLKDPAVAERVRGDMELGRAAGVDRTPVFFLNGRRITDVSNLASAVEAEFGLESGGSTTATN